MNANLIFSFGGPPLSSFNVPVPDVTVAYNEIDKRDNSGLDHQSSA